jgi:hypothetical protein
MSMHICVPMPLMLCVVFRDVMSNCQKGDPPSRSLVLMGNGDGWG